MQSCGEKKIFGMRGVLEVVGVGFSISAIDKVKPPQLKMFLRILHNRAGENLSNYSYSQYEGEYDILDELFENNIL